MGIPKRVSAARQQVVTDAVNHDEGRSFLVLAVQPADNFLVHVGQLLRDHPLVLSNMGGLVIESAACILERRREDNTHFGYV
jgi:hypothetical protein